MSQPKPNMATLRPILHELGLISEEDFARMTGTTESTRENWRKRGKGFPAIKIGNHYFYSIEAGKKIVQDMVLEKVSKSSIDDLI